MTIVRDISAKKFRQGMRSDGEITLLSVVLGLIVLGGVLGNLIVLLALRGHSLRQKPSSLLLANLALSNFLLAAVVELYHMVTLIKPSLIEDDGPLCHVGGVMNYPLFIVSLYTLVGMCVDRFYAFGNPLFYRVKITYKVSLAMVVYPWIHAVAFGLGTGFGIDVKYDEESKDCGLGWKDRHIALTLFLFLVHVFAPFLVLLVSNVLLFRRLRLHKERIQRLREQDFEIRKRNGGVSSVTQGFEKKVSAMVTAVLTIFLVCWTPYLITRGLAMLNITVLTAVQIVSVWILHCNTIINPILYTYFRKDLRNSIYRMLCVRRARVSPSNFATSTCTMH